MKVDAFVFEIGSTTTVVSAFDGLLSTDPKLLAQAMSPTTVSQGDVTIGISLATQELAKRLGVEHIEADMTFATSSAAGGLKMSVHGLVYDMTVKAAKEAALGAGANIKFITSGKMTLEDVEEIKRQKINIILLSGGVDFGESQTALHNSEVIASAKLNIPVIYAGNIQNHRAVKQLFENNSQSAYLFITKNVYPKIDTLDVEDTRKIIQSVFEEHIIHAPGMEKIRKVITSDIIPTPGAVMESLRLIHPNMGNAMAFDIGGATTDVHSVTDISKEIEKILIAPEPFAKRTVEGDLGVYINKDNLIDMIGERKIKNELHLSDQEYHSLLAKYQPIPDSSQVSLTLLLSKAALETAMKRHVGKYIHLYGPLGKNTYAEGKDCTNVSVCIGTGGVFSRLPGGDLLLKECLQKKEPDLLKPKGNFEVYVDSDYCMAACGVLSKKYPEAALSILKNSLKKV